MRIHAVTHCIFLMTVLVTLPRMARMSNVAAFFLIWSCGFCCAVQVFVKGAHGMVSWKDTPTWRDRSVVPTPPPKDVAAYKKRGEIPYPYPRVHVVKHVYVGPRSSIAQGGKANKKKNLIQKMFFSLPVGAELPIYYTHKQVSHKKSTVADSEGNEELSPDLETRTIAKQNLVPSTEGNLRYHGIGGQYLRPRTIDRYRVLKNRGQVFKRPSRTQRILNVLRRSEPPWLKMTRRDVSKTKKPSLLKQNNDTNASKNIKKSGLPKGETLDDVLTKLKPGKIV